jgi:DNA-binding MarR family transcriptional regulator
MTHSYNNRMDRLTNLLASASLGIHDDATRTLEQASGLNGSGAAALLALDEFLGGTPVGRLAEALGLTHSGAVRLVALLEREGLAERRPGVADRRQVEVRLTAAGRTRAAAARGAREAVLVESLSGLDDDDAAALEGLLERVVAARVAARMARRRAGEPGGAWWCRTCDFAACGRPEGRCPAQQAASAL